MKWLLPLVLKGLSAEHVFNLSLHCVEFNGESLHSGTNPAQLSGYFYTPWSSMRIVFQAKRPQ